MSFYSQNVPIITGSFYDNLNFGRRKMEPEVYQNIRFLDKFTKERDIFTPFILENGNNLSGGDKQRIALARMYTEEAEVLILDEPTSSLDETTEKDILDGISHCPDKIIFLITHRKENLRYCNKIYQIRDKRMVSVMSYQNKSEQKNRVAAPCFFTIHRLKPTTCRKSVETVPDIAYNDIRKEEVRKCK